MALGTAGEENVSVIVAPIGQSFRLQDLGGASAAAQRFLSTTVAPEGSDKEARLIRASERCAACKQWETASGSQTTLATLLRRASLRRSRGSGRSVL